jgi:acyl-CoA reductase-like NAD-dependent aldehyde dehydrogenase
MAKQKTTPSAPNQPVENGNGKSAIDPSPRLGVQKTYKMYVGGQFPRTESGRYSQLKDAKGGLLANICQASRKDFRDAVVVARKAFHGWSSKSPFNRGQILYRIAEMLEGRAAQFVSELTSQGLSAQEAELEVTASIDRLVHFAGWCDKYQQIFSSVNAVSSSHFNFSVSEPTGVVSAFAPQENGLIGLVSVIAPIIAGGNTCIVLASEKFPLSAVTFGEVLNSSDVPGGVVNILTGTRKELTGHFSNHMDVNATVYCGLDSDEIGLIQRNATTNVKRVVLRKGSDWYDAKEQSPYHILDLQETKTTWHPIGI